MQTDATTPKIIGLTIERFYRFFFKGAQYISNYDDDDDDIFKKLIDLMIKTTALHLHHAF